VVRLVGQHLTNPEIADKLFVARSTVKTHLVHIFSKLGESRSELAALALQQQVQDDEPSSATSGISRKAEGRRLSTR
jgi:DNA-binding NarL/FixJ family response regulator